MRPDLRSPRLYGAFIAVAAVVLGFYFHGGPNPSASGDAVSPALMDDIPSNEVVALETQAVQGDCAAASRLARFHRNVTLNYDASVKWTHIAAKCPDLFQKEMMLGMIIYEGQAPAEAGEAERLLAEIEALDPARAAHWRREVPAPAAE